MSHPPVLTLYPAERVSGVVRAVGQVFTGVPDATVPEHDLFLRGVVLTNPGDAPVQLARLALEVHAKEQIMRQVVLDTVSLGPRLASDATLLRGLPPPLLPFVFGGVVPVDPTSLTTEATLAPGANAVLLFEHLRLGSHTPPERLEVCLSYDADASEQTVSASLDVTRVEPVYLPCFPLKGPTLVSNSYDNPHLISHRRLQSQELALDLVQLGPDQRYHPRGHRNEEYACYGQEVLATADGEVVTAVDGVPDNPSGGAALLPDEQARIAASLGGFAALVGNHVVLRHEPGVCSLYVHLMPGSLSAMPGARVTAGTALGRVGNSGFSGGPHLHFALMDGPDPITARGLVPRFSDLHHLVWEMPVRWPLESGWLVQSGDPTA